MLRFGAPMLTDIYLPYCLQSQLKTASACLIALALYSSAAMAENNSAPTQQATAYGAPYTVIEECTRIGNKLGSVTRQQCLDRKLDDTGARSINGQAIMMKDYPPLPGR